MPAVPLSEIVPYLDEYLQVQSIPDNPNALNGLQVACERPITRVVAAVDASLETILGVVSQADDHDGSVLLLVHHGLFWDGNLPVTDRRYRRLKALFDRDIALYSAHIPLDVHAEVGNNVVLARELGVQEVLPFGAYHGIELGVRGKKECSRDALADELGERLGTNVRILPGGPDQISQVALITGAAAGYVREARDAGCDALITGEGMHHTYFDAMEYGVNVLFAGHYATEQLGVQALAKQLHTVHGLPWTFHPHPTGL